MPYADPQPVNGGEKWVISTNDGGTTVYLDVRIVQGATADDPSPSDAFQRLVNILAAEYELYAARQSYLEYHCTPEVPTEGA